MERRKFLKLITAGGIAAGLPVFASDYELGEFWDDEELDEDFVTLYDTYAMALYMDGGLGPKTGIIKVDYILENEAVKMQFWHGHGGRNHEFTVLPEHFAQLKELKKVTIQTTAVDGHTHKLFIDPVDPRWRVPGAQPVKVPKSQQ